MCHQHSVNTMEMDKLTLGKYIAWEECWLKIDMWRNLWVQITRRVIISLLKISIWTAFAQLFALPILNGSYSALPKLPVLMTAFLAIDPYVSSIILSVLMISKPSRPCVQVFLFTIFTLKLAILFHALSLNSLSNFRRFIV